MFNIIVADSNSLNAELIANCLNVAEYNVMISESGSNAIAKCRMFSPDLIISSVQLNDMSGYDLCRNIKQKSGTSDCIVLLINSVETNEVSIKALESGADDFMDMKFDALILQAKVKSLLRVKTLGDQLKEKYRELEDKNHILDMQLEMSRKVQLSLIQKPDSNVGGVSISNVYLPAIAIGGDFYDIIPIGNDKVAVIMGDVSGHGISSALITTMVLIMMRNLSEYYTRPDELLYYLNGQFINAFGENDNDIYICVFAAFIDTSKKEVTFSNAGLTTPLYVNSADSSVCELSSSGTPIGMLKDVKYNLNRFNYSINDILLFYTDGLCDTFYKHTPAEFIRLMSELLVSSIGDNDNKKLMNIILDEFCLKDVNESEKFSLDDVCVVLCRL